MLMVAAGKRIICSNFWRLNSIEVRHSHVDGDGAQNNQMAIVVVVSVAVNALCCIANHVPMNSSSVFVCQFHRLVNLRNRRRQTVSD